MPQSQPATGAVVSATGAVVPATGAVVPATGAVVPVKTSLIKSIHWVIVILWWMVDFYQYTYYDYKTCTLVDTTEYIQLHKTNGCKKLCTADVFAVSYSDVLVFKDSWHSHVCHFGILVGFCVVSSCVAAIKHDDHREANSFAKTIKTRYMLCLEKIKHNPHSNAHWNFWKGMLGLFVVLRIYFYHNGTASLSIEWNRKLAARNLWCCDNREQGCKDMWQRHWDSESAKRNALANVDFRDPATLAPFVTEGLTKVAGALGAHAVNDVEFHVQLHNLNNQVLLAETRNKVTQTTWMGSPWVQAAIGVFIVMCFMLNAQGAVEAIYACVSVIYMFTGGIPVSPPPNPRRLQQDHGRQEPARHPPDLLDWYVPARLPPHPLPLTLGGGAPGADTLNPRRLQQDQHPPDLLDWYVPHPLPLTLGGGAPGADDSASKKNQLEKEIEKVGTETANAQLVHQLRRAQWDKEMQAVQFERDEAKAAKQLETAKTDENFAFEAVRKILGKKRNASVLTQRTYRKASSKQGGSTAKVPTRACSRCGLANRRKTTSICKKCADALAAKIARPRKRDRSKQSDSEDEADQSDSGDESL